MKIISGIVALCFYSCAAMSQAITISSSPTINTGKVDSCSLPTSTALAALPSLAPVTNGSWDLSGTTLQTIPFTYIYKAHTAGFSTAVFSDSAFYPVGTTGIEYTCWRNVTQSSGGVSVPGEEILKRQAKGIGTITGNNLDSIVFAPQVIAFSNDLPVITYPATMSSKWSGNATRIVNFTVTATALAVNNAPGMHKQIRNTVDSVVGWGQMKVPAIGKPASAWIRVLQVQHSDIYVDSFFVNGAPAATPVLLALGVTQGQSATVARTYFYRTGAFRPLIEAVHSAPTHSSGVSKMYIHALDLPDATSVPTAITVGDIRLYPNPIRNGRLHLDILNAVNGDWSYSLINMAGQVSAMGALNANNTHTVDIDLPRDLKTGIYYVKVLRGKEQKGVWAVTIE